MTAKSKPSAELLREELASGPQAKAASRLAGSMGPASTLELPGDLDTPDARRVFDESKTTRIQEEEPRSRRPRGDEDDIDVVLSSPVADPLLGVVVADRYRIVEPLGRGGMGIVYKVEHIRIGKLLAMKLLTGELSQNREVVRRFKQEALTASKLSSPNTVQVFDFGVADRLTYLVMELVAGEDLARCLRSTGPMAFSRLGRIVLQVCASLAEAHKNGIVHRDIKPENVMLLRGAEGAEIAKVLDFGLAKLREGAELNEVTSHGAIVGTPYFMAPEQIRGEPVDARADIYALGALMYRALTGHYPFNGPTPMAVFTRHLTDELIPPIERAPERQIPPRVSAIVVRALARDPRQRFARAEDLRDAILEELKGPGTSDVRELLNSSEIKKLASFAKATTLADDGPGGAVEIATRDEVERYERKLRQRTWGYVVAGGLVVAAAGGFAAKAAFVERPPAPSGVESEPNDTAAQANRLVFDGTMQAHLGKRIDATHGDRDFFSFEVPGDGGPAAAQPLVKLSVTALPNFATCTLLYRQGADTPLARYCVGRPGRSLNVSALRLDPGRYFAAVLQDMDGYGGLAPFVHENVSDTYTISVGRAATAGAPEEIEPNDELLSATPLTPSVPMTATLAWARDVDVFCAPRGAGSSLRFRVADKIRDAGVVLEATPIVAGVEGVPIRVHTGPTKVGPNDSASPWTSAPAASAASAAASASKDERPTCVRVRAVPDPSALADVVAVPRGDPSPYTVELLVP